MSAAMKKVIVTGADGFVGSNTVRRLADENIEVLALDIREKPINITENELVKYRTADIANPEQLTSLVSDGEYDTVIHFAWVGSAGPQRVDYNLQMNNALWTVELMKTAKQLGCTRFVVAGSIMEREVAAAVSAQGSRPGMGYIYGMGKRIAHDLCKAVAADIGIELVWAMITNAYGEGELSPRFVNTTIRKIIAHEPLQFTAATQNYDFVHIDDVARAFYLIAKNGKPFCEYIIGSGNAKPLREFILEMTAALDKDAEPIFGDIPFTGTNLPLSAFDTSDTERDTGFKSQISFADGTKRTMEWLKTV